MATATLTEFQIYLTNLCACEEAREWAGDRTAQQAWDDCERADWLLWWLAKSDLDRKQLVRIACACARTALPFVAAGETRPLKAIETAEAWCDGRATIQEVRAAAADAAAAAAAAAAYAYAASDASAADAAYAYADAAAAAAAYAASDASDDDTYAAYAADASDDDAAYAADAAADAAYAYANAADVVGTAAAQKKAHQQMCVIIRVMASCPKV